MRYERPLALGAPGIVLALFVGIAGLNSSPHDLPAPGSASTVAASQEGERTVPSDTVPFRHADHELLDCLACHETGTPTMRTDQRWCSDCHHSGRTATSCTACHSRETLVDREYRVTRDLDFSVGSVTGRGLPFRHGVHESVECTRCHTAEGPTPDASGLDCTECHQDHHSLEADCGACHRSEPEGSHPVEAHLTCQGSGCHSQGPITEPPPRERAVCVACHQDMRDHRPEGQCVHCHVLPPPAAGSDMGGGT